MHRGHGRRTRTDGEEQTRANAGDTAHLAIVFVKNQSDFNRKVIRPPASAPPPWAK